MRHSSLYMDSLGSYVVHKLLDCREDFTFQPSYLPITFPQAGNGKSVLLQDRGERGLCMPCGPVKTGSLRLEDVL